MKRREALKSSAFLIGCGLSASTISAVLSSGCKQSNPLTDETYLGLSNISLLEEICETIIPRTSTPGAKDAGVHLYIDYAVTNNMSPEDKESFKTGLSAFTEVSQSKFSKNFPELSTAERADVMNDILDQGGQKNIANTLISLTKQLFFTSELGAKQALKYVDVPGKYIGCYDLAEAGGTWSE